MVPVGALLATAIGSLPSFYKEAAFAFGLMALLYLVTEELLVEAHEKPETAWGTALFFIGFLGLAALDQSL
jgi:ZIP family zinc transporter